MRSSFCGRRRDGCHKIPALWEVFRIPQYTMIQNTTKYTAPVRSIQLLHLQPRHTLVSCSNTECEHRFMVFLFQHTPTNTRDSVKCYCAAPKCGVACWMLMNTLAVDRGSFSPPLYLFDFVFVCLSFPQRAVPHSLPIRQMLNWSPSSLMATDELCCICICRCIFLTYSPL